MQNIQMLQKGLLLLPSLLCLYKTPKVLDHLRKVQGTEEGGGGVTTEQKKGIINHPNEVLYSVTHMTHCS